MAKPSIFKNPINHPISNNEVKNRVEESDLKKENKSVNEKKEKLFENNIKQKINAIFNSSNYIYKADVKITTKDDTFKKRIIGMHNDNLITIDNELIPINTIIDIETEKKDPN